MPGITLEIAQKHLDAWLEAELACTTNQSYTIGSRTLTRADLAEIRNTIKYWAGIVAFCRKAGSGKERRWAQPDNADHAQGFIKDCPPLPVFSAIIGNVKI